MRGRVLRRLPCSDVQLSTSGSLFLIPNLKKKYIFYISLKTEPEKVNSKVKCHKDAIRVTHLALFLGLQKSGTFLIKNVREVVKSKYEALTDCFMRRFKFITTILQPKMIKPDPPSYRVLKHLTYLALILPLKEIVLLCGWGSRAVLWWLLWLLLWLLLLLAQLGMVFSRWGWGWVVAIFSVISCNKKGLKVSHM